MGLEPGTTKKDVIRCLENWDKGDNGILDLSQAFRLKPGTGWMISAGVLHAPGSMCTYEPQWGSDVFGMFQSLVAGYYIGIEGLSVLENAALLGVPFPPKLKNALEVLRDKGNVEGKAKG
jgi:hypothetical protein